MMLRKDLHEENRLSWNEATKAHNSHKRDQAQFFREGGSTLFPEEIELLGDIHGLSLVHLQCNAGQDTLSLAQRGAVVSGVDISDEAIAFARQLAEDSGIPATFVRMDVYDWLEEAARGGKRFHIAFCSYGALCWLSDLRLWAKGISSVLLPGGRLVCVDFHPFWMVFDWRDWTLKYPYFGEGRVFTSEGGVGDYVADSGDALTPSGYIEGVGDFKNSCRCHEFQWTLGEIVTALLDAGMTISALREYPYSNAAKLCQGMRETPGRRMIPPEGIPSLPLMFGIVAQKVR
jgi:SAM-dependent methyltransferase